MQSSTAGENTFPPLESFDLSVFPRTTHNITWSPDAELAIACDDCIFVYAPEFAPPPTSSSSATAHKQTRYDAQRQYGEAALRFPVAQIRSPELNHHLFDILKKKVPKYKFVPGGGDGVVTSQGSSLNHVVALEWSPNGLGRMNRSVLAVLTGVGTVTVYCEGVHEVMDSVKLGSRSARNMRPWVAAWAVGGGHLVPAAKGRDDVRVRECIASFAWARDPEAGDGSALLAYMTDENEIVILSVQARHDYSPKAKTGSTGEWRVEEVDRFLARGPHPRAEPTDPDFSPSGSSFALSWSPWLKKDESKTCMLSYIAPNYVGFRQITLKQPHRTMAQALEIEVGRIDVAGVCIYLAPDAFVVWEDLIWTMADSKVCRGMIATPAKVQAFQLPFDTTSPIAKHSPFECDSAYPPEEESKQASNPITGLIIHPPSLSQISSTPTYSLVRLSATHKNDGWHQTNLPLPPNPEDPSNMVPQWATEIDHAIHHSMPRVLAYRYNKTQDGDGKLGSDDASSGEDGGDGMYSDTDDDSDDGEFAPGRNAGGEEDGKTDFLGIGRRMDTSDQVHVTRMRVWGMAASPGGGTIAVFVSKHSTIWPERDTYSGLKCCVLFGGYRRGGVNAATGRSDPTPQVVKKLSTEAKVWECMYGGGPPVPGVSRGLPSVSGRTGADNVTHAALRDHFGLIERQQVCVFCESALESQDDRKSSRCANGHFFENCATTGVPIPAPGISNTCSVCGSKSLKPAELVALAPHLREVIADDISRVLCGGCGGKFVN